MSRRRRGRRKRLRALDVNAVDFLYLAYLFVVVFMSTLGLTSGSRSYVYVVALGSPFAVIRIVLQRENRGALVAGILLIAIGAIEFFHTRRMTLLLTSLLLIGARGLDVGKVLGVFLAAKVAGLVLMGVFVVTGFFEVESYQYYKMGSESFITRVTVHGAKTNYIHLSLLSVWILYFFNRRGKVTFIAYAVLVLGNVIMERISGSYMGLVLGGGSLLLFFLVQRLKPIRRAFIGLSTIYLPVALLTSFGTALLYDAEPIKRLDRIFQGRIYYDHYFLSKYPFSLFGHGRLSIEGNFDNSYVFVWVCYGLIVFVMLFWAVQHRMIQMRKEGDWLSLLVMVAYLAAGISESFYPSAAVNPSLFMLTPLLVGSDEDICHKSAKRESS